MHLVVQQIIPVEEQPKDCTKRCFAFNKATVLRYYTRRASR